MTESSKSFKHPSKIKRVTISHSALKTRKRRRKHKTSKSQEKDVNKMIDNAIQSNAIKSIKKIGKKTRKNPIHLRYDSIIKLNKNKEETGKTKETSFTYPRGILQGAKNFVPRKKVHHNIRTAKKRKHFNMLPADEYKPRKRGETGEVVSTVKPIIQKKGVKRTKTLKSKKYTLNLQEPRIKKRKFTPIVTKNFDAGEIEKLMKAITYDGVLELRIKKEN
jgi:hypothetical protein